MKDRALAFYDGPGFYWAAAAVWGGLGIAFAMRGAPWGSLAAGLFCGRRMMQAVRPTREEALMAKRSKRRRPDPSQGRSGRDA